MVVRDLHLYQVLAHFIFVFVHTQSKESIEMTVKDLHSISTSGTFNPER